MIHHYLSAGPLILNPSEYGDSALQSISERLLLRSHIQPINLLFLFLFLCAILHSFLAPWIASVAEKMGAGKKIDRLQVDPVPEPFDSKLTKETSFFSEWLYFLSEIEVIFGIWCIPALIAMTLAYGSETTADYLNGENYRDALFIILAMAIASTYPIMHFAEFSFQKVAQLGKGTPTAWWFVLQLLGPLLGAFFKESIAMTISVSLLGLHFYAYRPSKRLCYASMALLFTNISIAGLMTNFAASSLTILKRAWGWDLQFMLTHFAWKSLIAVFVSTFCIYLYYRNDFARVDKEKLATAEMPGLRPKGNVPFWVTFIHLIFLGWVIFMSESPVIAFGSFVLFLGFYQATAPYQTYMALREPIMVGFFLASIMVLGGLQGWWISPIVETLEDFALVGFSLALTAINQNPSVMYIATQIPSLGSIDRYLLVTSIMAGGGLTYLSNGPNLIGYALLEKYFPERINPFRQLFAALFPAAIAVLCFYLLRFVPT